MRAGEGRASRAKVDEICVRDTRRPYLGGISACGRKRRSAAAVLVVF